MGLMNTTTLSQEDLDYIVDALAERLSGSSITHDRRAKPQKDWDEFEEKLKNLILTGAIPYATALTVGQNLEYLQSGIAPIKPGKKFYRKQWQRIKEKLQVNVAGSPWIEIRTTPLSNHRFVTLKSAKHCAYRAILGKTKKVINDGKNAKLL